jgi:NADPH:quinone reductase-like Zn-dependent oxidoreductase
VRALAITATDGPENAALHELPLPEPGAGEVRIALAASALNRADLWVTRGMPRVERRFPFVLGVDGAGTIDAVGAGVPDDRLGEEVVVNPVLSCGRCRPCAAGDRMLCRQFETLGEHRDGTHADAVCVPSVCAVPRPPALSALAAAAGATVWATAYRMLFTRARIRPGEVCLVHGIGGGLATAALQLARVAGATCVVTSSDDAKLECARSLGAAHAVNYRTGDVVRDVRAAVGAVDVVVDSVGAAVWPATFRLLAPGGRLVNCGITGGAEGTISITHLFWRQFEVLGSTLSSDGEFRAALAAVVANGIEPVIDRAVALEDGAAALLALDRGVQFGKIVVTR